MQTLKISKIKKMVKRLDIGIHCKIAEAKIDGTVCMVTQIRKPEECASAGCRHFKEQN